MLTVIYASNIVIQQYLRYVYIRLTAIIQYLCGINARIKMRRAKNNSLLWFRKLRGSDNRREYQAGCHQHSTVQPRSARRLDGFVPTLKIIRKSKWCRSECFRCDWVWYSCLLPKAVVLSTLDLRPCASLVRIFKVCWVNAIPSESEVKSDTLELSNLRKMCRSIPAVKTKNAWMHQ